MTHRRLAILALSTALAHGCAANRPGAPATAPSPSDAATLPLERIPPIPATLPVARKPATATAPLEALEIFADARAAFDDGRRYAAVGLLQKAIALDPDSHLLRFTLGEACSGPLFPPELAIDAFEAAVALRPDSLDARIRLARLYLQRENASKAIEHLRLGRLTDAYANAPAVTALTDLYLARALAAKGYLRAAADQYARLLDRLDHPVAAMRADPEIAYLIVRRDLVHVRLGELFDALHQPARAADAYQAAIDLRGDGDFDLASCHVRALGASGQRDRATTRAVELVSRFHANAESIQLLKEIRGSDAIASDLESLHRRDPADRALLFALADILDAQGDSDRAQALLTQALDTRPGDIDLIRRLFALHDQRGDVKSAARLLLTALAAAPDSVPDISRLFDGLLRPLRRGHLRLDDLRDLDVPPSAEGAKWFYVARLADLWGRDPLATASLRRAVASSPPFAPAYRDLLDRINARPDFDDAQRFAAADDLIAQARLAGAADLVDELRVIELIHEKEPDEAAKILSPLVASTRPSTERRLLYVELMISQNRDDRAESMAWAIISDHPTAERAHNLLFDFYLRRHNPAMALKVLKTWLDADPTGVPARLLQATVMMGTGRADLAVTMLDDLFADHPDDPAVLSLMRRAHTAAGRLDTLVAKLEAARIAHPDNHQLVEQLVALHAAAGRLAEARRALDDMRRAVADDPDLLYALAGMENSIGDRKTAEQVLSQVLEIEPGHAPANNDLGYYWVEDDRNLLRAVQIIAIAVAAEPDNQSYLDSLGWAQYKLGRFAEARDSLDRAIGVSAHPNPIVVDHLGDTLFRLGQTDQATAAWRRALDAIKSTPSDDLRSLRLRLQQKLHLSATSQPTPAASVPAVIHGLPTTVPAKDQ